MALIVRSAVRVFLDGAEFCRCILSKFVTFISATHSGFASETRKSPSERKELSNNHNDCSCRIKSSFDLRLSRNLRGGNLGRNDISGQKTLTKVEPFQVRSISISR